MKSLIFSNLLLGFIKVVFCVQLANDTQDETCPVTLFRRKRANMEYTRWRSNMETSPEFIVKVLDDTPLTTTTMGPGIISGTTRKREEMIVIGGAMVEPTSILSTEILRDYTRFQPPTTTAREGTDINDRVLPKLESLLEKGDDVYPVQRIPESERNVNRDESPPAGPHFLRRPGVPSPHIYPPIAPVAFSRHSPESDYQPLTPATEPKDIEFVEEPTRTSYIDPPTRTTPVATDDDKLEILRSYFDISTEESLTHTSQTSSHPMRSTILSTSESMFIDDNDDFMKPPATKKPIKSYEDEDFPKSLEIEQKQNNEGDIDNYRDVLINSDEYRDSNKKGSDGDNKFLEQPSPEEIKNMFKNIFPTKPKITDDPTFIEDDIDHYTTTRRSSEVPVQKTATTRGLDQEPRKANKKSRERRLPVCNMIKLRKLNFNMKRTLPEIAATLRQWAEESALVKVVDVTQGNLTTMENPIYMVIVDDPSVGQVVSEKQTVLIVAGIQGRDHTAVTAAMFLLYQLIERSDSHYDLLSKYRFWVIPVFNPDGYDYSMTFPHRREWMKNLQQTWDACPGREACSQCETIGLRCAVSPCYGVNLDRNFEYQWIPTEEIRAEHPCGKLYSGPRQLSEMETRSLTNFLHRENKFIAVFIAFKEGEVFGVMYPYSHTKKTRAFDHLYRQRATKAAASAFTIAGRPYAAGQTSEFLPLYAGGIEDWADGHLGIDNTYTIMTVHQTDQNNALIERLVHESFTAVDSLLLQSSLDKNLLVQTMSDEYSNSAPRHCSIKATSLIVLLFRQFFLYTTIT